MPRIVLWLCCFVLALMGCGAGRSGDGGRALAARAQEFRSRIDRGDYEAAQAMMAPDPRRWWGDRVGEGRPWQIGPKSGPWAGWDEHFRSKKEIVEWREGADSASVIMRETNDYFRLLERGWVTTEITYHFDPSGRIEGLSIRGIGERPPGRTDEFLAWAREHDPEELDALMPGGEIDPTGDHPERFRRLLNRWRQSAGLETID